MRHNILDVLNSFKGSTFASIDTLTVVKLRSRLDASKEPTDELKAIVTELKESGQKTNPQLNKVFRRTDGISVQLFTNSKSNGYENMVKRRLENEGKSAEDFTLGKAVWGTRIKDSPIIEHNGEYYLEVISQSPGSATYHLLEDGTNVTKEIAYTDIIGTSPVKESESGQGGLETKVQIMRYRLSSLRGIRANKGEWAGDFYYEAPEAEEASPVEATV